MKKNPSATVSIDQNFTLQLILSILERRLIRKSYRRNFYKTDVKKERKDKDIYSKHNDLCYSKDKKGNSTWAIIV